MRLAAIAPTMIIVERGVSRCRPRPSAETESSPRRMVEQHVGQSTRFPRSTTKRSSLHVGQRSASIVVRDAETVCDGALLVMTSSDRKRGENGTWNCGVTMPPGRVEWAGLLTEPSFVPQKLAGTQDSSWFLQRSDDCLQTAQKGASPVVGQRFQHSRIDQLGERLGNP
jgi:hypothetical protein